MALYLGSSEQLKLYWDGKLYKFNLYTKTPITNGIRLLSFDNFILKDSNGLYLTVKESE